MRMLSLLYRFTEINNLTALSTFYKYFVSPKIEYCSQIWSMACPSNSDRLNSILNFFLAIVRHRIPSTKHLQKSILLQMLNIQTPQERHRLADHIFLHKIVNGNIRSDHLLQEIHFCVPARSTRSTLLFASQKPRLCLIQRSLFHRLPSEYNNLGSQIDIFKNLDRLRRKLTKSM